MNSRIHLLCGRCGNAKVSDRAPWDPPTAVRLETAFCPLCEESGEYDMNEYFDGEGAQVFNCKAETNLC